MDYELYCIKDELSEFSYPQPFKNDELASRWFKNCLTTNEIMVAEPKDFSIWKVGSYNTKTGVITGKTPELITRG